MNRLDKVQYFAKTIPVVFASDLSYLIPTLVALDSIYRYSNAPSKVEVYLIVPEKQQFLFEEPLIQLSERYKVKKPSLLTPVKSYDDAHLAIPYIFAATYYRLALPDLLPSVKRCVYLDGDVIVQEDLSELFNSLSESDLIAGVRAAGYYWPESSRQYHKDRLELPELDRYVNAGVLVMNLRLMREMNCGTLFHELLEKGYTSQDQDILNKACYPRIGILPPKFNLMTKYHPADSDSFDKVKCLGECYSTQEWEEACQNPVVIHYADRVKPWNDDRMDFASIWWEQANGLMPYVDAVAAALPLIKKDLPVCNKLRDQLKEKTLKCDELKTSLSEVQANNKELKAEFNNTLKKLAASEAAGNELRENNKRLTKEKSYLETNIKDIYASKTWRLGRVFIAPLAAIKRLARKICKSISR